jgi:hypothetical protein
LLCYDVWKTYHQLGRDISPIPTGDHHPRSSLSTMEIIQDHPYPQWRSFKIISIHSGDHSRSSLSTVDHRDHLYSWHPCQLASVGYCRTDIAVSAVFLRVSNLTTIHHI